MDFLELDACDLVTGLAAGDLSAAELMEAATEEVPVPEVVVTVPEVGARALVGMVAEEDSARVAATERPALRRRAGQRRCPTTTFARSLPRS